MERFSALSRGTQLMFVAGVLLLIDSFLSWEKYDGPGSEFAEQLGVSDELSRNAWHGVGLIVGLLTVVLVAWLIVRLAAAEIELPVSHAMTGAVLGILILMFTVIKVLADTDYRTIWAWIGLVLAVVIAVGAWMSVQEAGGVDNLKSEATSMTGSGGSGGGGESAPAASTPPPAPAAPRAPELRQLPAALRLLLRPSGRSGRARTARPFRGGPHARRGRPPGLAEPKDLHYRKRPSGAAFSFSTRRPSGRRRPSPAVPRRGR